MTVITRNRAEEFRMFRRAPRFVAAVYTVQIGMRHKIEHDIQAGTAADINFCRIQPENAAHQLAGGENTGRDTVIAYIRTVCKYHILRRQTIKHIHSKSSLITAGTAPGHIQTQIHITDRFVLLSQKLQLVLFFFSAK